MENINKENLVQVIDVQGNSNFTKYLNQKE